MGALENYQCALASRALSVLGIEHRFVLSTAIHGRTNGSYFLRDRHKPSI